AAGTSRLIADRPHDVVGGQHREDVEPAPEQHRHLLRPHIDHPAQQPVGDAGRGCCAACRISGYLAHFFTPTSSSPGLTRGSTRLFPWMAGSSPGQPYFSVEAIWRISSGVCTPASGGPTLRYLPMASPPPSPGPKPIPLISFSATAAPVLSSAG